MTEEILFNHYQKALRKAQDSGHTHDYFLAGVAWANWKDAFVGEAHASA
jgi:hypothetical protein